MTRVPQTVRPAAAAAVAGPERRVPPAAVGGALALAVAAALAPGAADAAPEVRTAPGEYLAIAVEAEDRESADPRWILTEPDTDYPPETQPDPDFNHSDGASGNAYLELLPDHRVEHGDGEGENAFPPGTPGWYWGSGGQGPEIAFTVDFPEAGRYYVHARAYSTGKEDNGIHVGVDGRWPPSGERIQWCDKNQWLWSSQQRGFAKDEHCGKGERTIWIDVAEAGETTVAFSAREDGFELDRFMLIKDLSGGDRLCLPRQGGDEIDCTDADDEAIDGFVDVGVGLEAELVAGAGEARRAALATVKNHDGQDGATLVELEVELGDAWTLVEAEDRCTEEGTALVCALGDLGPGDATLVAFELDAVEPGALALGATVGANESDDGPANDAASLEIEVAAPPPALAATLALDAGSAPVGQPVTATATLANSGEGSAGAVELALTVPDGIAVESLPEACAGAGPVVCTVDGVPAGESVELDLGLVGTAPGARTLLLDAAAEGVGPMTDSVELVVTAPFAETGGDGEGDGEAGAGTDGGEGTDGDGGTDGQGEADGEGGPVSPSAGRLTGGAIDPGPVKVQESGGGALGSGLAMMLAGVALLRLRRSRAAAPRA